MYKLVATDMDGTLLTSRKGVSRNNAAALRQAARSGVQVAICTGRAYASARIYGWAMGMDPYVVSANGAMAHAPGGRPLFTAGLSDSDAAETIRILRTYGIPFHMFTPQGVFSEANPPWMGAYNNLTRADLRQPAAVLVRTVSRIFSRPRVVADAVARFRADGQCLKFFCPEGEPGSMEAALAALRQAGLPLEVTSSGEDNFELTAAGVHKAYGLECLASRLGIHQSEVVAVGDHHNDLEMLRWAGLGVAVANAVPAAKEAAKHVAPVANDQDAVAHVVHRFILETR